VSKLWITLPAYAGDYSGVCSAMYELGGQVIGFSEANSSSAAKGA